MSRKAVRVFNWKGIFYYTIYDDGCTMYKWDVPKFKEWYKKTNPPSDSFLTNNKVLFFHMGITSERVYNKYLKDEQRN